MNYFFDENFSRAMVNAVAALHRHGNEVDSVVSAEEMGFRGLPDAVWISVLAQHGGDWTVLTHDQMAEEWELVQSSGLTWFIFERGWSSLLFWDEAWKLVKAWPDIVAAGRRLPGRVFNVSVNGRVRPARLAR